LAAPVTVWTALTPGGEPAGITVASVLVAEGPGAEGTGAGGPLVGGDVARVLGLVDPLSDFWEAADASRRFVVHVVPEARWRVADQLAGRSPVALERFDGLRLTPTPWGPVLDELTTRAYCSLAGAVETGGALLVQGTIEKLDLPDGPPEPLVYLRGAYRGVRPVNRPSGSAG
jgi:flavin reductase (DIM6/NTAB) family NADH-FMN oxidoreductase RutF